MDGKLLYYLLATWLNLIILVGNIVNIINSIQWIYRGLIFCVWHLVTIDMAMTTGLWSSIGYDFWLRPPFGNDIGSDWLSAAMTTDLLGLWLAMIGSYELMTMIDYDQLWSATYPAMVVYCNDYSLQWLAITGGKPPPSRTGYVNFVITTCEFL